MTPPEAPDRNTGCPPPAVSVCLEVLKTRDDFLRAARAWRHATPSMQVQARDRQDNDPTIRVGFTCSRKVGNAVTRNRAKRRLREAARTILPAHGRPGWDYVLVGRAVATVDRTFELLKSDLRQALSKLHGSGS